MPLAGIQVAGTEKNSEESQQQRDVKGRILPHREEDVGLGMTMSG